MKPNILIIQTDQQSLWTISAYKKQNYLQTHYIDSLAEEGALSEHFYTNANPCTPSRGCFLSGTYPNIHGAQANNQAIFQEVNTFAKVLKSNGYTTSYFGKYHLDGSLRPGWVHPDRGMGFTETNLMFNRGHFKKIIRFAPAQSNDQPNVFKEIGDEKSYTTDWLTHELIDFINRNVNHPFLSMLSIPDPHNPYITRNPYQSLFNPHEMTIPPSFHQDPSELPPWINKKKFHINNIETLQKHKAAYSGMVKLIDDKVGDIISCLKAKNIYDQTIIIFTSDHGDYMGEHGLLSKNGMYESAYKIPFIIRYPPKIKPKSMHTFQWSTIDFCPTLLDLTDTSYSPGEFTGQSRADLLVEQSTKTGGDDFIFIEDQSLNPSEKGEVGIIGNEFWYAVNNSGFEVLFDRKSDPLQINNKANNKELGELKRYFLKKLIDHHSSIGSNHFKWLSQLI
ncbi:sulfatase-like hydrolase/transferase [Synechococcus sp. YX-04-1]|uniref:sulfatase-like hydrolase/transferase n=1 Tax=Synechococcus sp. YX-04-1 TaxID=3062778 RepID=UPI0026E3255D|nr:sulfatase-like hydrolase/transferase [Synechococcus sp. YX-04-1]MDO6351146.1 sulfatase-like hydrolase/transferase [Synechococcus sp. YX-04-1]